MRTVSAHNFLFLLCLAACRQARQPLLNASATLDTPPPTTLGSIASLTTVQQESLPTYVAHGACPFECCQYGDWLFQTSVTIRRTPNSRSDSVGMVLAGDSAHADSGLVVVHPIGFALIIGPVYQPPEQDSVAFQPGDTVELLDYEGEGYEHVRWRGRVLSVSTERWDSTGRSGARVIRMPGEAWWVHVTPRTAHPGWVLMTNVRVLGYDRCG